MLYYHLHFAFRLKLVMFFLETPFLFISISKDLIHQAFLKRHFHEPYSDPQSNIISFLEISPTMRLDLSCDFTHSLAQFFLY